MRDELLEPFREQPERSGIFSDFDGTLSEIVPVPADARPVPGARDVLRALASRFAVVAIVSGRSAGELHEWLGSEVETWGVHGAERVEGGRVVLAERLTPYAEMMHAAEREARELVAAADIPGALVEDKNVVIALHYRAAEDMEKARRELDRIAGELALAHDLERSEGRLVFELRPKVEFSKAQVILDRALGPGLQSVMFIGDDRVDLPAFDALDRLHDQGVNVVRVAVLSLEAPTELIERADRVVEGPGGVVKLLAELL